MILECVDLILDIIKVVLFEVGITKSTEVEMGKSLIEIFIRSMFLLLICFEFDSV